jgi:cytochrome b561
VIGAMDPGRTRAAPARAAAARHGPEAGAPALAAAPDRAQAAPARYSRVAVVLHWLVAALVLVQFAWGWTMQEIPKSPPGLRADAFNVHKSIGLCLLALMLVRMGWRIAHRPPPLPAMPVWQSRLARLTHAGLYVVLFVMPLAGYLGSVWSGYPVKFFGVTLPAWSAKDDVLKNMMSDLHFAASFVLLALFALHVAGALWHAFRGDDIMARMLFGPRAPPVRALRSSARA